MPTFLLFLLDHGSKTPLSRLRAYWIIVKATHDNQLEFASHWFGPNGLDLSDLHAHFGSGPRRQCPAICGHCTRWHSNRSGSALGLPTLHDHGLATKDLQGPWSAEPRDRDHRERAEQHVQGDHAEGCSPVGWSAFSECDRHYDDRRSGWLRYGGSGVHSRRTLGTYWLVEPSVVGYRRYNGERRPVAIQYSLLFVSRGLISTVNDLGCVELPEGWSPTLGRRFQCSAYFILAAVLKRRKPFEHKNLCELPWSDL